MAITNVAVAKEGFIVADYSTSDEAAVEICRRTLPKLPRTRTRRTYVYGSKTYNYILDDEFIYMCVSEQSAGSELPYAFLEKLRQKFRYEYDKPIVGASSKQADLTRLLLSLLESHNSESANPVARVERELDSVTQLMKGNIDKVMERGEHIGSLMDKTLNLEDETRSFRKKSAGIRRHLWWQSMKQYVILILIIVGVIFVVAAICCGGVTFADCRDWWR